jgi:DNA ligase-associated metallophosphoesterase
MLEAKSEIDVLVRNQSFTLLAERVAHWAAEGALFCSDLHWGRESFLQSRGFAVPEATFEAESSTLAELAIRKGAREIWVLGDLIHHPQGLDGPFREKLRRWVDSLAGVRMVLVPGNHDRAAREWAPNCGIALAPEGIRKGEFRFLHEAESGEGFVWSGHTHPSLRIPELFGNRKLPCFLLRRNEAHLPAYSRLAGGAEIGRLSGSDRIYPIHEGKIFHFGLPESKREEGTSKG